ncbi:MAG TPA: cobalt-precorrin 5A hydrolase [Candidatus Merdenecus merdavium]|nr:cobalt-precorrin 5A hydrolase [Candidatus Merdenecus merdavium]
MRVSIISFTATGSELCVKIRDRLREHQYEVTGFTIKKYAKKSHLEPVHSLSQWTREQFLSSNYLIFIGACGIAVRSIAPYIKDKTVDPAVLVIDEKGNFIIPILSGHIGGANALSMELENMIHGKAVITTATDIHDTFAVDVFAKKNGLSISDMKLAKKISAYLLDGNTIDIYSDFDAYGEIPKQVNFIRREKGSRAIPSEGLEVVITEKEPYEDSETQRLYLTPQTVTIGVGCKKNTEGKKIRDTILEVLEKNRLHLRQIELIASIDLKKEEVGIHEVCTDYNIPFITYSALELQQIEGDFTPSEFVRGITGVSNVCERSAVLGSKNGHLIQKKYAKDGVTIALAVRDWRLKFE